jgi:hypothetical protein
VSKLSDLAPHLGSEGADLDLCYLSATEAIEAFKTRTLSLDGGATSRPPYV